MNSKYKFLSKNIGLYSISSFGQKFLALLLMPVYTSFLTTGEYGTIDLITTTVSLLVPIFTLNISEAVMRFTIKDKSATEAVSIGVKVIIRSNLILLLCIILVNCFSFFSSYRVFTVWVFFSFFLNSWYSLYQNYARATDNLNVFVVGSIVQTTTSLLFSIFLIVVVELHITGYYLAQIIGLFAAIAFLEIKLKIRKKVSSMIPINSDKAKELYKYSVPTVFTAIAWWINTSLDHYMVTGLCGIAENGIYAVAYKIPNILGIFNNIFTQAWTLSAITEYDKKDTDSFFGNTYDYYNSAMIIMCSAIIFFNVFLSKILYAKEFFAAWQYVPLLLISTLFSALSGFLGGVFSAAKDTKTCAYSTVISAFANIVLNFILIPRFGVLGAAIATAVSYIIAWMIRLIVSRKYIKMRISFRKGIIGYCLVIIQAGIAMTDSHAYLIQGALILLICITFRSEYTKSLKKIIING